MTTIQLKSDGANILDVSDISHVILIHKGSDNEAAVNERMVRPRI